jgi:CubicO group peptidase (beta-lactamase class C family)
MIVSGMMGLPACGDDGDDAAGTKKARPFVYPDPDWVVESPEAHDLDGFLLEEAVAFAASRESDCLVVTRDGAIVGEWYWNGWQETTEQNVFSVTKSFTSALVGIAQDQGDLDITDRASDYITEWVGTASEEVTIRSLISNDSGRHWDLWTDYVQNYALADDKTAHAIGLDQPDPPGTVWRYNNSAIQTLERVLKVATGTDVAEYAERFLFEPLGMSSSYGRDRAGNPITYADLSASCRDLARFGVLYLRGGSWSEGRQILSREWAEESVQPAPLNSAYGYMWWLNREGVWLESLHREAEGRPMPNLPEEVYRASGAFNQIVFVDPDADIVFTRIGGVADLADLASTELVEGLAERIRAARLD